MIIDDTTSMPQYEFEMFYKILNLEDSLKEHIPSIKQVFIDYYGEENKDYYLLIIIFRVGKNCLYLPFTSEETEA